MPVQSTRQFVRFVQILLCAVCFFLPTAGQAMRLTPDSADVAVMPGGEAELKLVVENDGAAPKRYTLDFLRVEFHEDAERLSFLPLNAEEAQWFSADQTAFVLNAGATWDVAVTVHIPKDAAPEALTYAVFVREQDAEAVRGSVAVESVLASLMFLHIGEGLEGRLQVVDFTASTGMATGESLFLSALLRNIGNDTVMIPASVEVRVKNMFGKEVDRVRLVELPKRIPPNTFRSQGVEWPKEEFKPFLFGEYTFELVEGEKVLVTSRGPAATTVTFLPAVPLIGFAFAIASLVLGILIYVRKRR